MDCFNGFKQDVFEGKKRNVDFSLWTMEKLEDVICCRLVVTLIITEMVSFIDKDVLP